MPEQVGDDGVLYNRSPGIHDLRVENIKLREEVTSLKADLSWHKQYTSLDKGLTHPRAIAGIIRQRDEVQGRLSQFHKMVNLFLNNYNRTSSQELQNFVRAMEGVSDMSVDTDCHIRSLGSFLTKVYDLSIERRFYEAVMGKPLEWIPVRTEVINEIESRIQIFDGAYEFGQRVCDGRDLRTSLLNRGGNKATETTS